MQEFFGASLFGLAPRYEKALVMIGEGRNGKSTALSVLEACFRSDAVTSVPPALWSREYDRAHMSRARLNCVRDMPSRELVDGGEIKQIISGEKTTARLPYGKPYEYTPQAAHVFACNSLPAVGDRSDGFWRRFVLLAFDVQVPEDKVDVKLGAKLREELPGIVAWAREGAERLQHVGAYRRTKRGEEVAAEWRLDCDPVARFVAECIEIDETEQTTGTEVYTAYREWCAAQGHHPMTATKMGLEMKRLRIEKGRSKRGVYYKCKIRSVTDEIADELDEVIPSISL